LPHASWRASLSSATPTRTSCLALGRGRGCARSAST
jgi:hypothetical protein